MTFLSICLICKNEARYLPEWLEYHLMLGVEHFYIYDNGSEDDPGRVCEAYAEHVTLIPWPVTDNQQKLAYQHYVRNHACQTHWTAFIDADEFIVYKGANDFLAYLKSMDSENGIMMQWELFGTGGHVARPRGLVVENYRLCYSVSPTPNIKTVCQASRIVAENIASPHRFPYQDGRPGFPEQLSVVSVFHYVLRSREDLLEKLSRGDVWSAERAARNLQDLQAAVAERLRLYDNPDMENSHMLACVPELKKRLRSRGMAEASA